MYNQAILNADNNFIKQRRAFYRSIGYIICPALDSAPIYFNRHGFNHLFRKQGNIRPISDIVERLKLLEISVNTLKFTHFFTEHKKVVDTQGKVVLFWAFITNTGNKEVKVVVRKVGNSKRHFFSVYSRQK